MFGVNILRESRNIELKTAVAMMGNQQQAVLRYREDIVDNDQVLGNRWSDWILVIIPRRGNPAFTLQRPGNMPGYIFPEVHLNDKLLFNSDDAICGIYEWAVRPAQGNGGYTVYIGSTGNMATRISDYCRTGSHKAEEINRALNMNYNVYVRFKITDTREDAVQAETDILRNVTYAWNAQYPNPAPRQLPP